MEKPEALRYYLAGVVWGEGCFWRNIYNGGKLKHFGFQVTQKQEGRATLELFKEVFNSGKIRRRSDKPHLLVYECRNIKVLVEKIVPYFDGILTSPKNDQFEKWKKELLDYYKNTWVSPSEKLRRMHITRHLKAKGFPTKNNLTLTFPK
jgi:hypothetical protein